MWKDIFGRSETIFETTRSRWKDNIEISVKEIHIDDEWIELAQTKFL
jgi:hypothetical protein